VRVLGGERGAAALVCTPLRLERAALRARRGGSALRVVRTGMGPLRAAEFAEDRFAAVDFGGPVVVAGIGGGLASGLRAGDIVVASEVRGVSGPAVPVPSAPLLAGELRRLGLRVHVGPIVSSPVVVDGRARRRLAGTGALAVDMESLWLAEAVVGRPLAVLRSIVDTPEHPLWRPGTLGRGVAGLRALRRAVPALEAWARAISVHDARRSGEGVQLAFHTGAVPGQPAPGDGS
jgi:4-hydroxy-3-methylbut-2-enyl diphosphate reductase